MSHIPYIENIKSWQESFHFYHSVKVRFSETDMFGHLNNTVPFVYFEEARIEFFKRIGLMQKWTLSASTEIPVVANIQCDFIKQVFFDQHLKVYVKVNHIGSSSIDLHYMGTTNEGEIVFSGRGTIVQISKSTGKSSPWSEEVKELLMNDQKFQVN
ncbi:acyl-CoA thioesterase [Bacillus timonensis]|nr:acyl-CoA thioesterase [Bacillus timonensis]